MGAPGEQLTERLSRPAWVAAVLLLASAAISWWLADRLLPSPDEGASLTAAAKILDGAVFYRDIDAYPFPGAAYLLALGMGVFGEHLSVARGLAGAGFCWMVLATYAAALGLMDRPRAALCGLSLLALKFLAFPDYTMFLYVDFSIAAAMTAVALLLRQSGTGASVWLFGAGVFVGLATVTKQNVGIYLSAVIAALLLWPGVVGGPRSADLRPLRQRLAALGAFAAGVAVPCGAMALYFASQGLLGQMIVSGLIRPFSGYLPTSGVSALPPLAWWNLGSFDWPRDSPYLLLLYGHLLEEGLLPGEGLRGLHALAGEILGRAVYTGMPVAFLGVAWLRFRTLRAPRLDDDALLRVRGRFFASAAACLAIAASAFPRADMSHVTTVYPAVLLTLFALGSAPTLFGQPLRERRPTALAAAVFAFVLAIGALQVRHDAIPSHRMELERAGLWVRPKDAWVQSLVETVRAGIPEGEPLLVYGHEAQFYFLTDRYFPWRFTQLYPGMAGGDDGRTLEVILFRVRPYYVIEGVTHWPGVPTLTDYTRKLARRIVRGYVLATPEMFRERPPAGPIPPPFVVKLWRMPRRDELPPLR